MKSDIIIAICWLLQPILLVVGFIAWAGLGLVGNIAGQFLLQAFWLV
jgi:hypothetical protein